ncbi:hypothetical protein M9Y10_044182 [Tritrichomonas musculus]|uniref:Uncharacterized protein n=1 Tax=Tritrichomonas musculus TaxID=1915356 RepID=A0ABR2K1V1_9EUKA
MSQTQDQINSLSIESEKIEKEIQNHGKVFQENANNFDFQSNNNNIINNLKEDLLLIERYIIKFSKNCLCQLNDWNNLLVGMDTQINEVSGLIQRVKSDAGSRLIDPMLETGAPPAPEQEEEIPQQSQYFTFPDYPFDINTRALDFVGHHVDDIKDKSNIEPLITQIKPGDEVPIFWSKRQDFFQPVFEAKQDKEEYDTSFSDFYKFNPAPEFQF